VPQWLLERLAAQDLSRFEADELRSQLAANDELDRLEAIEASNRAILSDHPPERAAAEIQRRMLAEPGSASSAERRRWIFALPSLAAVAALMAVFVLPSRVEPEHLGPQGSGGARPAAQAEPVRIKGLEPRLLIYKKTAAGPARLETSARVSPGDVVQVAYVAASRRYGVVASVDSAGTVTLHLPETAGTALPLARDGEIALPHSFELDAVPGVERFVFVTGDKPFTTADVVAALRTRSPLPTQLSMSEFLVIKGSP
jgi:hypothetical protein